MEVREMWHDYDEREGGTGSVHAESYDDLAEQLGETLVSNEVLQAELAAWKYTAARTVKTLARLSHALACGVSLNDEALVYLNDAEALLRELRAHWTTPASQRDEELDKALSAAENA